MYALITTIPESHAEPMLPVATFFPIPSPSPTKNTSILDGSSVNVRVSLVKKCIFHVLVFLSQTRYDLVIDTSLYPLYSSILVT